MDNNIADLLNKALSNPETLEKVATLLPVVSNLMGDGGKKIIETSASSVKPETAEPQNNSARRQSVGETSQDSQISPEKLIANEDVRTAFKNLITAVINAQDAQPAAAPAFAEISRPTPPESDAADAPSSSGNILNDLFNNSANAGAKPESSSAELSDVNGGVERALGALQKFSGAASPEKDERVKLLLALKPFLKNDRQNKVDTAIKYMSAAKILNLFGKNGFV